MINTISIYIELLFILGTLIINSNHHKSAKNKSMLCPRQGANCCYIDNVKLLQDLIKITDSLLFG